MIAPVKSGRPPDQHANWAATSPESAPDAAHNDEDTGLLGDKGGSMHLTNVEHGMMCSYAVVGRGARLQQIGAPWQNMS